jgi:uncharacterized protein
MRVLPAGLLAWKPLEKVKVVGEAAVLRKMSISDGAGETAVRVARDAIEARVRGKNTAPDTPESEPFTEPRGVFVTINRLESGSNRLRGCIGFPLPVKPLGIAVQQAAVSAATEDPRFPPVSERELDSLVVEVSILTVPTSIKGGPQEIPGIVRIGVDGLIVTRFGQSGLLLPQVANEFGMDSTEFLSQACIKAGLPPDSWLEDGTEVQVFQAEVFGELSPRGKVKRMDAINTRK